MFHQISKQLFSFLILILLVGSLSADDATKDKSSTKEKIFKYPFRQAHAHNDYHHSQPLLDAVKYGFCSVEADIFLVDGKLLVGHSRDELKPERTLTSLYLEPLRKITQKNQGRVFVNYSWFTLMIDVKTDAVATYRVLEKVLQQYDDILTSVKNGKITPRTIRVVISGNRAWKEIESDPERHCGIDGRLEDLDSKKPAHIMPMISDNWGKHFQWRGEGPFPENEKEKLIKIVKQAHRSGRTVRFWNTPEKKSLWTALYDAEVDLINTDQLKQLHLFLRSKYFDSTPYYNVPYFVSARKLPDVIIGGKKAHIHTQGLYFTKEHFYVTGRLNEQPRRALLLRFSRSDPERYEVLDITPGEEYTKRNNGVLDHPGGFDYSGTHLWIPISASRRKSLSVIVKVPVNKDVPLKECKPEVVFEVNDHIGALSVATLAKKLYGANWDTMISYCWSLSGEELQQIPKDQMIKNQPDQHIAVQDWKTKNHRVQVVMSGLDKRSDRSPLESRALIYLVNMKTHEVIMQTRVYGPDSSSGNMTHEGFHFDHRNLWFLPDDIGSGASLYRYQWFDYAK